MSSSSFTCSASTQTVVSKVKHVHHLFSDLLDLAIYSFGCQRGLRAHHKVRGGSVLEGVSAILGRMLLTRNPETKAAFEEITPTRLGNWKPGEIPTKELLTLISSRIEMQKKSGVISEAGNPQVPSLLLEEEQSFSEEEDRVKYRYFPRCWRCGQHCQFCIKRKKFFPKFGNFTMEYASPFLDVLEDILKDDPDQDDQEEEEEEVMESQEEEIHYENYKKCISREDMSETEEEDGENHEDEGGDENSEHDDVEGMNEEDII
ncbi:hypothetical protein ABFA07_009044 [Porites harrisoni]